MGAPLRSWPSSCSGSAGGKGSSGPWRIPRILHSGHGPRWSLSSGGTVGLRRPWWTIASTDASSGSPLGSWA
eukprot:1525368-Lingulodinium_polyedra.AAC.1